MGLSGSMNGSDKRWSIDTGCPEEETLNVVERVVMLDVEFESATGLTFQQLLLFLTYCPGRSRFWVDAGVLKYSEGKILR